MKFNKSHFYIIIAIGAQSCSLILSKKASMTGEGITLYFNIFYILSLFFLGIQALVWQQALKIIQLNIAYSMMSLVFIIVPCVSFYFFNESLSLNKVIGICLILIGSIIMNSRSKND